MENNNTKKGFLIMDAGMTVDKEGKAVPYLFMGEGIVTNLGNFREAADGKAASLTLNVAMGRDPRLMLGKEAVEDNLFTCNAESPFGTLFIRGNDAANMKGISKGSKVVFCGRPVKNEYKKKDGTDAASVTVYVDAIYVEQNKNANADEPRAHVRAVVNRYERDGEVKTQNLGFLVGTVSKAMTLRTTQSGQDVASANIKLALPALQAAALINREYDKDKNYGSYMEASISVWGSRASKMEKILVPGNQIAVLVSARVNTGNDGRQYVNLSVRDLSVMKWANPAPTADAPSQNDTPADPPAPADDEPAQNFTALDDDDMDLPF